MSYKGKILVAKPSNIRDIFSRSVVLIIEHDEEGALGFIVNKRNNLYSLAISDFIKTPIDIYDGGPMGKDKMFFMVKGLPFTEEHTMLNDEYYITSDLNITLKIMDSNGINIDELKAFTGYSGWSAGQLDDEVLKGYWYITDVPNFEEIMTAKDSIFWKKMMEFIGGECLIWANTPSNILMN